MGIGIFVSQDLQESVVEQEVPQWVMVSFKEDGGLAGSGMHGRDAMVEFRGSSAMKGWKAEVIGRIKRNKEI
ncbi:unnamed protein product [Cuscuta campestris]|uniref:Uncharacterized protein n=1 Tax=Cuscuta campestris TaxID=132261 RepID=A0A484L5R6_9ASTE|nr:unnamed protein product [Cuscuta campestris]